MPDNLPALLVRARAAFEKRMRARLVITRASTDLPTTGPGGVVTPSPRIEVYGTEAAPGKGYVRYPGLAFEQNPESAGLVLTISRVIVRIPFGSVIRPNDEVHILTDPDNPQLQDVRYLVASIDDQSQATAQRLLCKDDQSKG